MTIGWAKVWITISQSWMLGFFSRAATNDMIGNRSANSFNGMLLDAQDGGGIGRGTSNGQVCLSDNKFGKFEANTFHGSGRFGKRKCSFIVSKCFCRISNHPNLKFIPYFHILVTSTQSRFELSRFFHPKYWFPSDWRYLKARLLCISASGYGICLRFVNDGWKPNNSKWLGCWIFRWVSQNIDLSSTFSFVKRLICGPYYNYIKGTLDFIDDDAALDESKIYVEGFSQNSE